MVYTAEARALTNTSELHSFLGLVNYYGRFLPSASTGLCPLNRLLQKGATWAWSKTFQGHQRHAEFRPGSCSHDPTLPLSLAADVSAYGVGPVISQRYADGGERPIA